MKLYQSNYGMAGNCEAGGFVNSAVRLRLHVPSTSQFLSAGPVIFLTDTLTERMTVQPIHFVCLH